MEGGGRDGASANRGDIALNDQKRQYATGSFSTSNCLIPVQTLMCEAVLTEREDCLRNPNPSGLRFLRILYFR